MDMCVLSIQRGEDLELRDGSKYGWGAALVNVAEQTRASRSDFYHLNFVCGDQIKIS